MSTSRNGNVFKHLPPLRFAAAKRIGQQVSKLARSLLANIPKPFFAVLTLGALSRALNILALAGTIKIASMVMFDWTRAIGIGKSLGLSMDGVTKDDIAWTGGAIMVVLYLLAGITAYAYKRSKADLRGQTEVLLYDRFLNHPQLPRLLNFPNIQQVVGKSISAYARCSNNLAEGLSLTILCTIILIVLSLHLPMMIALVLLILLPVQLFYLLAGRKIGVRANKINEIEARRRELLKQLTSPQKLTAEEPTPAQLRREYLQLTKDATSRRTAQMGAQASPDIALSAVAGVVLAGAMIFLSGLETDAESLIYLLIGFILIRFLFLFIRNVLQQAQSIMQNLDQVRFVNETILSPTVNEDALPASMAGPDIDQEDFEDIA